MTTRLRVGLLFGGRSAEHDVSVLSAGNVFRALDPAQYDVIPIAITKDGTWVLCNVEDGRFPAAVPASGDQVVLLPGGKGRMLMIAEGERETPRWAAVDVLFPVLHGPFGEDGTIQGLAELAGVPYVGSDVLGSAAAMDKGRCQALDARSRFADRRLPCVLSRRAAGVRCRRGKARPSIIRQARAPGLSVGVAKAASEVEFAAALKEAFRHDDKILVEEYVPGREIECGILENEDGSILVSVPGEIVPTNRHSFYTYEAKYMDDKGAELKSLLTCLPGRAAKISDLSLRAFRALGCAGLARVDFFLCPDGRIL